MPLFRKHRGSLKDSLETTIIVKDIADLRKAIYEDWAEWEGALNVDNKPFTKDSFKIKIVAYYGECDYRCGWYTQLVSADLIEPDKFMVVGFLSEPME